MEIVFLDEIPDVMLEAGAEQLKLCRRKRVPDVVAVEKIYRAMQAMVLLHAMKSEGVH